MTYHARPRRTWTGRRAEVELRERRRSANVIHLIHEKRLTIVYKQRKELQGTIHDITQDIVDRKVKTADAVYLCTRQQKHVVTSERFVSSEGVRSNLYVS